MRLDHGDLTDLSASARPIGADEAVFVCLGPKGGNPVAFETVGDLPSPMPPNVLPTVATILAREAVKRMEAGRTTLRVMVGKEVCVSSGYYDLDADSDSWREVVRYKPGLPDAAVEVMRRLLEARPKKASSLDDMLSQ